MYLYVITSLVVIYIVFFMVFRIRHRFWATQPVFHYHNLWYWLFPPGIINYKEFPITKYYKPFRVTMKSFDTLNTNERDDMHQLISHHYLQDKEIQYHPSRENIETYFASHNHPCYYASQTTIECVQELKKGTIQKRTVPISVLTSRPLYVSLYDNKFITKYVDYLCVNKKYRGKHIAPQTIYTYAVESRKQDNENITFLFKREGESTAIVPLTVYKCYWYNTQYWKSNVKFPEPYKITQITDHNKKLLLQSFDLFAEKFPCFIYSNISNICELIRGNIIIPFIIHNNDLIIAVYFYRNGCVTYQNKQVIDLVASILLDDNFTEFFQLGLLLSFSKLVNKYGYLNIENISHNYILVNHINKKYAPMYSVPYSYYFYNFATRPILNNHFFVLA